MNPLRTVIIQPSTLKTGLLMAYCVGAGAWGHANYQNFRNRGLGPKMTTFFTVANSAIWPASLINDVISVSGRPNSNFVNEMTQ